MAASILSLGMLTARAFWITRRSIGFECGSVPPDFTAILMSFAIRANCFAMRFHRANIVCLRTSNILPIDDYGAPGRGKNEEGPHLGPLLRSVETLGLTPTGRAERAGDGAADAGCARSPGASPGSWCAP